MTDQPIRIYLDSNVISFLRNDKIRKTRSDINFLYRFIFSSKTTGNVEFPYSDTHLSDIVPSYKKGDIEYVEHDLAFLSALLDNKYICLYWEEETPTYGVRQPKEFFNNMINDKSRTLPTIEEFEESLTIEGMPNLFKIMPSGLYIDGLTEEEKVYFAEYYPRTYQENNMYNIIADGLDMMRRIMTDPEEYNKLKKQFSNYIPLDKNVGNGQSGVIETVNRDLTASPLGKSFDELLEMNNKQYIKSELCHRITSKYMHLNFIGYASEKLTDKNKYDNLHNDARHCFYGAYCNIFVTNDKRAYKKAKAIYEEEQIGTRVMNTEEFETFAIKHLTRVE